MNQDLERYKKLLNELKSSEGAGSADKPLGADGGPPDDISVAVQTPTPVSAANQRFLLGTLICVDGGELGVYQRTCSQEGTDIVLLLMSDGSLKVERTDLGGRSVEELGLLRPDRLRELKTRGRWSRALIAGACRDPEDAARVPAPEGETPEEAADARVSTHRPITEAETPLPRLSPTQTPSVPQRHTSQATPTPGDRDGRIGRAYGHGARSGDVDGVKSVEKPKDRTTANADAVEARAAPDGRFIAGRTEESKPDPDALRRGRRVTLRMGSRAWTAIYWGRDMQGHVLVHNTSGAWELTRLNLYAYKKTMVLGDDIDADTMHEIMRTLDTIGQQTTDRMR